MSHCLPLRDRAFAPGADGSSDPEWLTHIQACPECRCAYQTLPLVDRALLELVRQPTPVPAFDAIAKVAGLAARNLRDRGKVRRLAPTV